MTKAIKFIVAVIISCVGLQANAQVICDKTKDELKGVVSSCTTRVFKAVDKFGEIQKGDLSSEETTTYDKKGFKLSDSKYRYENSYTSSGKISVVDIYVGSTLNKKRKFNHQSLKTIETVYGEDGAKKGDIVWTKNKSVDNASDASTTTTTYNVSGNPVGQRIEMGNFLTLVEYAYNPKGFCENMKMTIPYVATRTISYSQYKYDTKGNWVYRVKSQDGEVIEIEEREITY